jgi:bacteriorhodopsin
MADLSNLAMLFLWIGFFCMFGSFLIFYSMLRATAPGKRLFHAYTCGIVGFAATAYLFMALGKCRCQRIFCRVFTLCILTSLSSLSFHFPLVH